MAACRSLFECVVLLCCWYTGGVAAGICCAFSRGRALDWFATWNYIAISLTFDNHSSHKLGKTGILFHSFFTKICTELMVSSDVTFFLQAREARHIIFTGKFPDENQSTI